MTRDASTCHAFDYDVTLRYRIDWPTWKVVNDISFDSLRIAY